MGRTHSEILFSFSTKSLSDSSLSCLLPPSLQKEKEKKPYFCPLANATAVGKKAVVQNIVQIQVSEEANWSIVRGTCGSHIFCLEVQISSPIMMETTLIRWNTMFPNVHSAWWYQSDYVWKLSVMLAQCLLYLCCRAVSLWLHGIPVPSVESSWVCPPLCWLVAPLLCSLVLGEWEDCQE